MDIEGLQIIKYVKIEEEFHNPDISLRIGRHKNKLAWAR
jgi:hypothetical protein